ncbi:MAG: HD domain-containing protein [Nitrosopumilaceae archaeon]
MLEDFFQIIINLKNVQRKGWKNKLDLKNSESVADHSYSMTLMALILSEIQGMDTKKIVKMSLLHDLAESVVGDLTPDEITKSKKLELENNAMKKILTELPNNLTEEYQEIWNEFQMHQSEESVFVHEIDKLEMAFQANTYLKKGFPMEKIQSFIDNANNEIQNKQLQKIMSNLFQ